MATVKTIIRTHRANASGLCTIYCRYTHQEESLLISSGEKLSSEHFDASKGRARRSLRGSQSLNELLDAIESKVLELSRRLRMQGQEPTLSAMRQAISAASANGGAKGAMMGESSKAVMASDKTQTKLTALFAKAGEGFAKSGAGDSDFQSMSQHAPPEHGTASRSEGPTPSLSSDSASHATGLSGAAKREAIQQAGRDMLLHEMLSFYHEAHQAKRANSSLQRYRNAASVAKALKPELLVSETTQRSINEMSDRLFEKGQAPNTVGSFVKTVKSALAWAEGEEMAVNASYKRAEKPSFLPDVVALSSADLAAIEQLDLSADKGLETVRDGFVLACLTGLRYSDLCRLRPEHLRRIEGGEGMEIYMRAKKTGQPLRVPLSPRAESWLSGRSLAFCERLPSNDKANQGLKKIAKAAGLNETIFFAGHKGRQRIELSAKKHELVGTHTARRTFVTLSLSQGMRPETVMRITGHKSYTTMMRYLAITRKDTAEEIAKAWK